MHVYGKLVYPCSNIIIPSEAKYQKFYKKYILCHKYSFNPDQEPNLSLIVLFMRLLCKVKYYPSGTMNTLMIRKEVHKTISNNIGR